MSQPRNLPFSEPARLSRLVEFSAPGVLGSPCLLLLVLAGVVVAGLSGCGSREEIRHYQAPKITAVAEDGDGANERMLAAILLNGDRAWFFKLVGPEAAVDEQADHFRDLIKSLKFVDGKPKWSLPEGWKQEAGSGIRFATLKAKSDDTDLEVSVTTLSKTSDDDRAYYLDNINRWRGQLQLGPLTAAKLDEATEQIQSPGGTAVVIDIVGKPTAGGPRRPPFAGMNPGVSSGSTRPSAAKMKFEKPDNWEDAELVVSRGGITLRHEAAFSASDGDQQVEITVDRMPSSRGMLANVNRWRRQVGLPPLDDAGFAESVEAIELVDKRGAYVQMVGDEQTILGVIAEHDGQAWFIKLKGDNLLAKAEQKRFEDFVHSIRFE